MKKKHNVRKNPDFRLGRSKWSRVYFINQNFCRNTLVNITDCPPIILELWYMYIGNAKITDHLNFELNKSQNFFYIRE
jgi:hypothetical protein